MSSAELIGLAYVDDFHSKPHYSQGIILITRCQIAEGIPQSNYLSLLKHNSPIVEQIHRRIPQSFEGVLLLISSRELRCRVFSNWSRDRIRVRSILDGERISQDVGSRNHVVEALLFLC